MQLTRADASIVMECVGPVKFPDKEMSQADVERYWSRDRASLVRCAKKHKELVRYYDDLFTRVGKQK